MVAFDGSRTSRRALDAAADLMGYGSSLTVVHVRAEEHDGRAVDLAREDLLRRHVVARYLELCGDPADEVVEAARAAGADLLVVGRRDAVGPTLGSVSGDVVSRVPCDVLVVG
jgi:nucleotide-binding universal stress UspA family protein